MARFLESDAPSLEAVHLRASDPLCVSCLGAVLQVAPEEQARPASDSGRGPCLPLRCE